MLASKRPVIAEHAQLNFEPGGYADENGQRRPMYRMTAEGLTELTMGFSGDDAREVRIRFIEAFKELATRLARAERSLVEQIHALERREMPSRVKGQIGSKLMNERRREKNRICGPAGAAAGVAETELAAQLSAMAECSTWSTSTAPYGYRLRRRAGEPSWF